MSVLFAMEDVSMSVLILLAHMSVSAGVVSNVTAMATPVLVCA